MNSAIKILLILLFVCVMGAPILLANFGYCRDEKNKITHKHFRIVIYTLIYAVVVTIVLSVLQNVIDAVSSWQVIEYFSRLFAVEDRTAYCASVIVAIGINIVIGYLYLAGVSFLKIGLKKKDLKKFVDTDARESGESKLVKFFYKESWGLVAKTLRYVNCILSAIYVILFILYLLPVAFGAKWLPYEFMRNCFESGYVYPIISLLVLWESYFFLRGVQNVKKEDPELVDEQAVTLVKEHVDISSVEKKCSEVYQDRYLCSVSLDEKTDNDNLHHRYDIANLVFTMLEKNPRVSFNGDASYAKCLEKLVESTDNLIFAGSLYSEFNACFVRYLGMVLAKGENVIFVCDNNEQVEEIASLLTHSFSVAESLYALSEKTNGLDSPVWGIIGITERSKCATINDKDLLVTTLDVLNSSEFIDDGCEFAQQVSTIVFVDTVTLLLNYATAMSALHIRLTNLTKKNAKRAKDSSANKEFAVRYNYRPVRYLCFDDREIPGLDKALKNLFSVEFESMNCMRITGKSLISCYRFESDKDRNGTRRLTQFVNTEENLGLMLNIGMLCRANGISQISMFVGDSLPYNDMIESYRSNAEHLPVGFQDFDVALNRLPQNAEERSALIVFDEDDNLPSAIRRFVNYSSNAENLIIIISKPYLLRDYYAAKLKSDGGFNGRLLGKQLMQIPIAQEHGYSLALKIIVKAAGGGISEQELYYLANLNPMFSDYIERRDTNAIMVALLEYFGIPTNDRNVFYQYFEYSTERGFNDRGEYEYVNRVHLRRNNKLAEIVDGRDFVKLISGNEEYTLPIPKERLTQNHIVGQNMVFRGSVYRIAKIDLRSGQMTVELAHGGRNETEFSYIQSREYHICNEEESICQLYPVKRMRITGKGNERITVNEVRISAYKAPMEVVTSGYYPLDAHALVKDLNMPYVELEEKIARQTYRRYGEVKSPTYGSDGGIKYYSSEIGATILSIRIKGVFGENVDKISCLAAVMLHEIVGCMYPDLKNYLAVVPVLHNVKMFDADPNGVFTLYPRTSVERACAEDELELLIIEDSGTDLGVVASLAASGDDPLRLLFAPVADYLDWYLRKTEAVGENISKDYLKFGRDEVPGEFDFEGVRALAKILSDSKLNVQHEHLEMIAEYERCDFCGRKLLKGPNIAKLDDGRCMCDHCANVLVGNNKETLTTHMNVVKLFLENEYDLILEKEHQINFESTMKVVNMLKTNRNGIKHSRDIPLKIYNDDKNRAWIERDVPSNSLKEMLLRQYTYLWKQENIPDLSEEMTEGLIAYVSVRYLKALHEEQLANIRLTHYESTDLPAGSGYGKIAQILSENPGYHNNPFKLLAENNGVDVDDVFFTTSRRIIDIGKRMGGERPKKDSKAPLFYYERLSVELQEAYRTVHDAIVNFQPSCRLSISYEDVRKVCLAVTYDDPELFQYRTFSYSSDGTVAFCYGTTQEEYRALMEKIQVESQKFCDGIDDSMGVYDVALRLHNNLIDLVDYDSVTLNEKKLDGTDAKIDEIDYLRSICGVFLNHKAVCAGYAAAMSYLLRQYGIECAYVVGNIIGGTPHAWNVAKLDGEYYHLDITWDDGSNTNQTEKNLYVGYNYFCVTTEEILRTRDLTDCLVDMPICTAVACNYYTVNNAVLTSYDVDKISAIAEDALDRGAHDFAFKCSSEAVYKETYKKLFLGEGDIYKVFNGIRKVHNESNVRFKYTYDDTMRAIIIFFS